MFIKVVHEKMAENMDLTEEQERRLRDLSTDAQEYFFQQAIAGEVLEREPHKDAGSHTGGWGIDNLLERAEGREDNRL